VIIAPSPTEEDVEPTKRWTMEQTFDDGFDLLNLCFDHRSEPETFSVYVCVWDTCSASQPMCLTVQCVLALGLLKKELMWASICGN